MIIYRLSTSRQHQHGLPANTTAYLYTKMTSELKWKYTATLPLLYSDYKDSLH